MKAGQNDKLTNDKLTKRQNDNHRTIHEERGTEETTSITPSHLAGEDGIWDDVGRTRLGVHTSKGIRVVHTSKGTGRVVHTSKGILAGKRKIRRLVLIQRTRAGGHCLGDRCITSSARSSCERQVPSEGSCTICIDSTKE